MAGAHIGAGPSLRYHRYNVHFTPAWFKQALDEDLDAAVLNGLAEMDKPANMAQLEAIGQRAAERFVKADHFAPAKA
jgi:hypothetical protein